MNNKKKTLILVLFFTLLQTIAYTCTVVFWNNIPNKLIGRNMDWYTNEETEFWVLPRGIKRDGMVGKNSMKWESKYGSTIIFFDAPIDGVNEKGLTGHLLWLGEADFGKRNEKKPGIALGFWLQYYLDNFATVKEAVEYTKNANFQFVETDFEGKKVALHLYLTDESGDVAVIEYLDGKPVIHHGKEYVVMTNSPTYDKQIENLKQYKAFGGSKELPGSTEAADRFVRALYYLENLPLPTDYNDGIAKIFSVTRNVSQPFRISNDPTRPDNSTTRWRTAIDVTNKIYYFEATNSPNIVWLDIKKVNYEKGSNIMKIKVQPNNNIGDITTKLEKTNEMYKIPLPNFSN